MNLEGILVRVEGSFSVFSVLIWDVERRRE